MTRSLTGIKPTGTIHVGNYLGAMRPALELVEADPALATHPALAEMVARFVDAERAEYLEKG